MTPECVLWPFILHWQHCYDNGWWQYVVCVIHNNRNLLQYHPHYCIEGEIPEKELLKASSISVWKAWVTAEGRFGPAQPTWSKEKRKAGSNVSSERGCTDVPRCPASTWWRVMISQTAINAGWYPWVSTLALINVHTESTVSPAGSDTCSKCSSLPSHLSILLSVTRVWTADGFWSCVFSHHMSSFPRSSPTQQPPPPSSSAFAAPPRATRGCTYSLWISVDMWVLNAPP